MYDEESKAADNQAVRIHFFLERVFSFRSWAKLRFGNVGLSRATWAGLASTSVWQAANYLIPLLTVPYLTRILGVSGYGIIGIGAAIASYALLLTNWGFEYSATQAVAQARGNPDAVSRILWETVSAKLLLGLLSSGAIVFGALVFVPNPSLKAVLLVSTLNVAGSAFNVEWVLRGMERLSRFAAASIIGRSAAVPLVFLLVRRSDQMAEAVFASAAGGLVTAAVTWEMARRMDILRKPRISARHILILLKDGAHLFLSTIAVNLYTASVTVILGAATGTLQVGLFVGADKIKTYVNGLLSPILMVFYPRMSFLASTDPKTAHTTSLVLLRITAGLSLLLSVGLCSTAPIAVRFLLGNDFGAAIPVLQILSWLIFLSTTNTVLADMIMLPFGLKREFSLCILWGTLVGLGSVFPLSYYAGAVGAAIAAVLAEIAVMFILFFMLVQRFSWFKPLGGSADAR
jgi:O-antigen/teichoic acid export membrane protein